VAGQSIRQEKIFVIGGDIMALYSEKVMDHFIMKMYLKIDDDVVSDVKFETFGCGSAIASSSMATELIKGKPLKEVLQLTNKAVTEALDGLPTHKLHCSVLAEEAIRAAVKDYCEKNNREFNFE